jgi:hypothetical protein
MRISPFPIVCLACGLMACGQKGASNSQAAKSEATNSSRSSPASECLAGLPSTSNPEQAAMAAASRGDLRIFRYYKSIGAAVGFVVAGFEECQGRGLAVRGQIPPSSFSEVLYRADTIELGNIWDQSHPPENCTDCDLPLSICGQQRLTYAARYNRTILDLGARGPRPGCPTPPVVGGGAR